MRKIPSKRLKKAKVGETITIKRKIKGNKRKITLKKTSGHGKNKNLKSRIISNKPA